MKSFRLFTCIALLLLPALHARAATFSSQLIANLPSTPGSPLGSSPGSGVQMGGYFYFAASDAPNGTNGLELWRTDGTPAGTTLVKDIRPGPAGSSPSYLTAAGTNLFFFADDGIHGVAFWRSDGTANGTYMVANVPVWTTNLFSVALKPAGNWVYFSTTAFFSSGGIFGFSFQSTLYRSDGTSQGTFPLSGPGGSVTTNSVSAFDVSGTDLLLVEVKSSGVNSPRPTNTVWRFSGSGPYFATALDTFSDSLRSFLVAGTNCYFLVTSNYVVTSPTSTNTYTMDRLLRHTLNAGGGATLVETSPLHSGYSSFSLLGAFNGRLLYSVYQQNLASDPQQYLAMKGVNGSAAPVTIEGAGASSPYPLGAIGANIYYGVGNTLIRRTDGTSAGVNQFDFASVNMQPYNFLQAANRFYLFDGTAGDLAITDFTPAGTHGIDSVPGTNIVYPQFLGSLGNTLIYSADDGTLGTEPYRTDGTTNGTYLLKDIAPGAQTSPPVEAVLAGNLYYFTLDTPGVGLELWKSDGTALGTALVKDIRPGTNSSGVARLTAWNGLLYFTANNGTNGTELWRSDGTAAGTYMVKDCRFGPLSSNPSQLTPAGSQLFFLADDGSHGTELWRTDGTDTGTYMLQDIVAGTGSGNIRSLGAADGVAYFFAGPTATSGQFWLSYGVPGGTQLIQDFGSLPDTYLSRNYTAFDGLVYFLLGPGLFRYDPGTGGTALVQGGIGTGLVPSGTDFFVSGPTSIWKRVTGNPTFSSLGTLPGSSFISQLTALSNKVYFSYAEDLWKSDGITNTYAQAADFLPSSQSVSNLNVVGGALVFSAATAPFGREFWAMAPGQTATLVEDLNPGSADAGILFPAPLGNRLFYVARPNGQPYWQLRALDLQSIAPPPRSPYNGSPATAPGRIEAEQFDIGGEGVAFHDTTIVNEGGQFRKSEGVDIELCSDSNGGYDVTTTRSSEWLEYTFTAATAGRYRLDIRLLSTSAGAAFALAVDGALVSSSNAVPDTSGSWATLSVTNLVLGAGNHILRLSFIANNTGGTAASYNWLDWVLVESNAPPTVTITSPTQGAVFKPGDIVNLQATVVDSTSVSPPVSEFLVDGVSVGTNSGFSPSALWTATPGVHAATVRTVDSFGSVALSQSRLFLVGEPLIGFGDTWLYNDNGLDLGPDWHSPKSDSGWKTGTAQFGFGDGDETTLLAETNRNNLPIITYYFRKRFVLTNEPSSYYGSITLLRDDAAVVFINGQEFRRVNLPRNQSVIAYTNLALTNINNNANLSPDAAIDRFPLPDTLLAQGTNTIAVEIHQAAFNKPNQFDVSFDLEMIAIPFNPNPRLTISSSNNLVYIRWPSYLSDWTLISSTNLSTWTDPSETPTLDGTNNVLTVTPTTLNFYRLTQ